MLPQELPWRRRRTHRRRDDGKSRVRDAANAVDARPASGARANVCVGRVLACNDKSPIIYWCGGVSPHPDTIPQQNGARDVARSPGGAQARESALTETTPSRVRHAPTRTPTLTDRETHSPQRPHRIKIVIDVACPHAGRKRVSVPSQKHTRYWKACWACGSRARVPCLSTCPKRHCRPPRPPLSTHLHIALSRPGWCGRELTSDELVLRTYRHAHALRVVLTPHSTRLASAAVAGASCRRTCARLVPSRFLPQPEKVSCWRSGAKSIPRTPSATSLDSATISTVSSEKSCKWRRPMPCEWPSTTRRHSAV